MANPRRSMLYIPGNSPGMIQHAPIFGSDSVLLDLEDAVSQGEKDAARMLVANFLRSMDYGDMEVTVRVNGADTAFFRADLEAVVPCRPDAVRIPKCNGPEDVLAAGEMIDRIEKENGLAPGSVKIHAMLETALGIENAFAVAICSPRVDALTLGGQDLTADLGVPKTREGAELLYARSRVVMAAHAAGVASFDTIWADVNDNEGLLEETRKVIGLGFTGKAAIHPGQIDWIHEAFRPSDVETAKARRIIEAAGKAERAGRGVVAVDGRMVDAPVVRRARRVLDLAALYTPEAEEKP